MATPQMNRLARRLCRDATAAERVLWQAVRPTALGVGFRRQHPIPPYIADFAAPDARLVVEVDGGQHGEGRDALRDAALAAAGWRVLRFWNDEVLRNTEGVLQRIAEAIAARRRGGT
jgi:very-short-patch-repair endonuclease